MRDERKWRLALAEFDGVRHNVPGYVSEQFVRDYHAVLDRLADATEEELEPFRIPITELKPRIVSFQLGGRRRPGSKQYSKDNYCDSNLFQRKIDGLSRYIPTIEQKMRQPQATENSKDYWSMSTPELEGLAGRFNIGGFGDQHGHVDREIIIKALLQRDKALLTPTRRGDQLFNYGTISNSNLQQGSPGSSANVNLSVQEQRDLIAQVRAAVPQLELTADQVNVVNADIGTIELQLNSGNPKKAIVSECWQSVRSILEGLAGNMVAAGVLYELAKLLQ